MNEMKVTVATGDVEVTTVPKTTAELHDELQTACKAYQVAANGNDAHKIAAAKVAADKALSDYNASVVADDYAAWYAMADPMLAAITAGEHLLAKVTVKVDRDGVATVTTDPVKKLVDIESLESRYTGKGFLAHNGQWRYWIEKFTMNLNLDVADELDASNRGLAGYVISAKGIEADIQRVKAKGSKTQLVAQLQQIIDGIVFVDNGAGLNQIKVTTVDLAFLREQMTSRGRAINAVAGCKKSTMVQLFTRIAHCRINGKQYELTVKTKKEA